MNYDDLLNAHLRFGTTKEDIIERRGYNNILENVVIAPWWKHEMFEYLNFKIEKE